jgi:integrase
MQCRQPVGVNMAEPRCCWSRQPTSTKTTSTAQPRNHVSDAFRFAVGTAAIRSVVRRAFRCAGIPHGRTHALRRTLVCRLVSGGSPIKEVADVLRHRSLNTSLTIAAR